MQHALSELDELVAEASRQFSICNACRYCEGYCAVFPAIERRRLFTSGDLGYIANVCHDCRACYQACMYTEPHEFDLNLPALLSEARDASYAHYARPRTFARVVEQGPGALVLNCAAMCLLVVALIAAAGNLGSVFHVINRPGAFYALIPHVTMMVAALTVSGLVGVLTVMSLVAFARDGRAELTAGAGASAIFGALRDGLTLRWLRGGGVGCYYPSRKRPSGWRRRFHHLVAHGFAVTFAATVAAFVYESILGELPPYGWLTAPVQLGLWGGLAIVVGASGLLVLKLHSDPLLRSEPTLVKDCTFIVTLLLVAGTGIALLLLRSTDAMGTLLVVHLALVLVLLVTAPYTKFVHAVYRLAALYRSAREESTERLPSIESPTITVLQLPGKQG